MLLSERIIEYRAAEDISQAEFAKRAKIGRDIVGRAENNKNISRLTKAKIERVLNGGSANEESKE